MCLWAEGCLLSPCRCADGCAVRRAVVAFLRTHFVTHVVTCGALDCESGGHAYAEIHIPMAGEHDCGAAAACAGVAPLYVRDTHMHFPYEARYACTFPVWTGHSTYSKPYAQALAIAGRGCAALRAAADADAARPFERARRVGSSIAVSVSVCVTRAGCLTAYEPSGVLCAMPAARRTCVCGIPAWHVCVSRVGFRMRDGSICSTPAANCLKYPVHGEWWFVPRVDLCHKYILYLYLYLWSKSQVVSNSKDTYAFHFVRRTPSNSAHHTARRASAHTTHEHHTRNTRAPTRG